MGSMVCHHAHPGHTPSLQETHMTRFTAQKLTRADMLANISYVPAGVVELMRKQQQGWAYIRP